MPKKSTLTPYFSDLDKLPKYSSEQELALRINLRIEDILALASEHKTASGILLDQLVEDAPSVVAMLETKQLFAQVNKAMESLSTKERQSVEKGVIKAGTRDKLRKLLINY